jgi:hypothetical protein
MHDIAAADPSDRAHPIFGFLGPLGAMGVSINDIFELCKFDPADGPMLASTSIEFTEPLSTGGVYTVSGRIIDVVRKRGRRAGVFDLMTFELDGTRDSAVQAVRTTNVFVLPRRGVD